MADKADFEQTLSPRAGGSRGKRFGILTLSVVAIVAFGAGGATLSWTREPYETALRRSFPLMLALNSPASIQVNWSLVQRKEIAGTTIYSGPATYIVKNTGYRDIKLAFPPQNSFLFNEHGMSSRDRESIPQWARQSFVLTLKPGEERRYDEFYSAMTSSPPANGFGPIAFDFAAPADADATEYATGTVLCTMTVRSVIKLEDSVRSFLRKGLGN